jgi:hypothetical protein
MAAPRRTPPSVATIISIALPAFALEAFVHEVLGHTLTAWLTGAQVILISSTAMQTRGGSRLVPASGPLANLVFGVLTYLAVRRISRFSSWRFFLRLFAFANLFLGTGYILYSGVIDFGDAAYVIAGLHPAWLYRAGLIAFGALGYRYSVALAVGDTMRLIRGAELSADDVPAIIYPSCLAGSLLYLVASFFNPVSPSLILYDGLSMACGVAIGLVLVPGIVKRALQSQSAPPQPARSVSDSLRFSPGWILFGCVSAILFLIFLGRGIRLR